MTEALMIITLLVFLVLQVSKSLYTACHKEKVGWGAGEKNLRVVDSAETTWM